MTAELYAPLYGKITWKSGLPEGSAQPLLPGGTVSYSEGTFGRIVLQEAKGEGFHLRYFIFYFTDPSELWCRVSDAGLQFVLLLKGAARYGIRRRTLHDLSEGQFTLLSAKGATIRTFIAGGRQCHLLSATLLPQYCPELPDLFPRLHQDLRKAKKAPRYFLPAPRTARYTVLDAVRELMSDSYHPALQKVHRELKIKQVLFILLTQAYTEQEGRTATPQEKEYASRARQIIESDITRHLTNEELARRAGTSESTLKRAFRQEYGMGLYTYLRTLRLLRARELLLKGEQVKTVAPAVGMRPTSLVMEFQKFFGYKISTLRRAAR